MSTVLFLLGKALSSCCFSQCPLATFAFQAGLQSRRLKTAVNFAQFQEAKSPTGLGSQETVSSEKGHLFNRWWLHDSYFLTTPLCSWTGSQSRLNKELARPASLHTAFNIHLILVLLKARLPATSDIVIVDIPRLMQWGWWQLLRRAYLLNSRSHCFLVSTPCSLG